MKGSHIIHINDLSHIDTSRSFLKNIAYVNLERLENIAQIYNYQHPRTHPPTWAMSHFPQWIAADVLDVGCGPASVISALTQAGHHAIGVDLSASMLDAARPNGAADGRGLKLVVADAADLPFREATFDAILLLWVLYHVPDPMRCLVEARRVMRQEGVVLVGTIGPNHLRELWDLWASTLEIFHLPILPPVEQRFNFDNSPEVIGSIFDSVRVDRRRGQIILREAGPALRYLSSTIPRHEAYLGRRQVWKEVLSAAAHRVNSAIADRGALTVATDWVLFVCREGLR